MTYKYSETIMVNLLKQAVESEGCHLSEVDLESLVIKVNGPDGVVSNCTRVAAEFLD